MYLSIIIFLLPVVATRVTDDGGEPRILVARREGAAFIEVAEERREEMGASEIGNVVGKFVDRGASRLAVFVLRYHLADRTTFSDPRQFVIVAGQGRSLVLQSEETTD